MRKDGFGLCLAALLQELETEGCRVPESEREGLEMMISTTLPASTALALQFIISQEVSYSRLLSHTLLNCCRSLRSSFNPFLYVTTAAISFSAPDAEPLATAMRFFAITTLLAATLTLAIAKPLPLDMDEIQRRWSQGETEVCCPPSAPGCYVLAWIRSLGRRVCLPVRSSSTSSQPCTLLV